VATDLVHLAPGAHVLIAREAADNLLPYAFDLLTGPLQLLFS
jgi:hypothetical protein